MRIFFLDSFAKESFKNGLGTNYVQPAGSLISARALLMRLQSHFQPLALAITESNTVYYSLLHAGCLLHISLLERAVQ